MRLPQQSQLTEEQKKVYFYAPIDKHVLVSGPPGTGKTVIACLRALELKKRKKSFEFLVYSRVLKAFASRTHDEVEIPAKSFLAWFFKWWRSSGLPPHPEGGRLVVRCEYHESDRVKALGAKWDYRAWRSDRRKPGALTIQYDEWQSRPVAFGEWRMEQEPPRAVDGTGSVDWKAALQHTFENFDKLDRSAFVLGTFLVDEGQDFPPETYKLLKLLGIRAQSVDEGGSGSCVFVLADENQRITDNNSTLGEIEKSLGLSEDQKFELHDNFRNTLQVAVLARHFHADVGHLPNLPTRTGDIPMLVENNSRKQSADFIARWIMNNAKREVGVVCFSDKTRRWFVENLSERLEKIGRKSLKLQTYSSKESSGKAAGLDFDRPDTITVLNMQSFKGLEFDCVFIVEPSEGHVVARNDDIFKMQMFVAVSRAREVVFLLESNPIRVADAFRELLPDETVLSRTLSGTSDAGPMQVKQAGKSENGNPRSISRSPVNPPPTTDWIREATNVAAANSAKIEDKRQRGGCFWIYGGQELGGNLKPLGFKFAEKRRAWWRI